MSNRTQLVLFSIAITIFCTGACIGAMHINKEYGINLSNLLTPIGGILTIVLVFLTFQAQSKNTSILIKQEFDRQALMYLDIFDRARQEYLAKEATLEKQMFDNGQQMHKSTFTSICEYGIKVQHSDFHQVHTPIQEDTPKIDKLLPNPLDTMHRLFIHKLTNYRNSLSEYIRFVEGH